LKIKILKITNNSISFGTLFKNDTNTNYQNIVIDIKSKNTIVTVYNNQQVVGVINHEYGANEIIMNVKKMLKISDDTHIKQILNSLMNLNYVNEPIAVINKYNEQFLAIKEATSFDVKKCLTHCLRLFLSNIFSVLTTTYEVNSVLLNVNDFLFEAIQTINFELLNLKYKCELVKNNVIGLEEKNVCCLLSSINYVYESQSINEFKFSIDDYVSQEISINQIKQNILLKLGLISTKWAAKLGE
jgi:hypothetical protein